jgi:hypothetical protein
LVTIIFKIEGKLQESFRISRNYMRDSLVKIDLRTNCINLDCLITKQWVYINNTGFVFSDQKLIPTRKNNAWCLLDGIGARQENKDQNLLLITNIKSGNSEIIFRGKYEKDKLELNNKIISIRRVLYHAIYSAQSN